MEEVFGSVVDLAANRMYMVRLADGAQIVAHVEAQLQMRIVRLIPGDRVAVRLSERNPSRGRIVRRLPAQKEQGR